MCGIAGLVQFDNAESGSERTLLLTRALAHRGPDDEGIVARGPAVLGHRRLSIIDLEGGRQPLANEDATVWVSCNGEIYNYRDLRQELKRRGHLFRTNSDTEVVVHAYEQWGDDCVTHFRGMFAFAILDTRRQRVFLARDPLGIKPLYYLQTRELFAFASELQALRHLPDVSWDIDLQALDDYLALQYIPSPATIYRATKKLPPASRLSVTFDGRVSPVDRYWDVEFQPNHSRSEADTLAELDSVLRDSVQAHLAADVPFGAFLSGGLDSSTIVAYMSEFLGRPVRTFSIGFDELGYSELEYARTVSTLFATEHQEAIVTPDALGILPDLVHQYGEPFGDNSAVPTYYVSQLARANVTMVLSGDGGDELFAGYDDTYMPWMQQLATRGYGQLDSAESVEEYMPFVARGTQWREAMWHPELGVVCSVAPPLFRTEFDKVRHATGCSQAQYVDLKTYLPHSILTKVDIASMMHGLEVRTPLVDRRVVEFAATIPPSYNVRMTGDAWTGKVLLKKNASRWFSNSFIERPKQGFGLPLSRWLGETGAIGIAAAERFLQSGSPLHDYFRTERLGEILLGRAENLIWRLLFLDEWLRQERKRLTCVDS